MLRSWKCLHYGNEAFSTPPPALGELPISSKQRLPPPLSRPLFPKSRNGWVLRKIAMCLANAYCCCRSRSELIEHGSSFGKVDKPAPNRALTANNCSYSLFSRHHSCRYCFIWRRIPSKLMDTLDYTFTVDPLETPRSHFSAFQPRPHIAREYSSAQHTEPINNNSS